MEALRIICTTVDAGLKYYDREAFSDSSEEDILWFIVPLLKVQ